MQSLSVGKTESSEKVSCIRSNDKFRNIAAVFGCRGGNLCSPCHR